MWVYHRIPLLYHITRRPPLSEINIQHKTQHHRSYPDYALCAYICIL